MVLLDGHRRNLDANAAYLSLSGYRREQIIGKPAYQFVVGGPLMSPREWDVALATPTFAGEGQLRAADGGTVAVQWAATVESVTGHRLVLFVALNTSRWARAFAARCLKRASREPSRSASGKSCIWSPWAGVDPRSRMSCESRTTLFVRTCETR
jgi:PAS domain-containing protein